MEKSTALLIDKMIMYNAPDIRRVNHAVKVLGMSAAIGVQEGIESGGMKLLEAAAVLHDIGIHKAEELYNSTAGSYQQKLGPEVAEPMLSECGFTDEETERICYLIAHHHTYGLKDDKILQILIEADFIVNIDEGNMFDGNKYESIYKKIFETDTGKKYLNALLSGKLGE